MGVSGRGGEGEVLGLRHFENVVREIVFTRYCNGIPGAVVDNRLFTNGRISIK